MDVIWHDTDGDDVVVAVAAAAVVGVFGLVEEEVACSSLRQDSGSQNRGRLGLDPFVTYGRGVVIVVWCCSCDYLSCLTASRSSGRMLDVRSTVTLRTVGLHRSNLGNTIPEDWLEFLLVH